MKANPIDLLITRRVSPSNTSLDKITTIDNATEMIKQVRRSNKLLLESVIGVIVDVIPRINKMLKILEPTTVPNAKSTFPLRAATIDDISSGNDVPSATMLIPITD